MARDFDVMVNRRGGDSVKWNRYAGRDVLPLWVADMDFPSPPAMIEALHRRVDHGVFGYGQPWPSLTAAVLDHLEDEYAWSVQPDWLVWLPGLVTGLNVACRAVAGDVVTATPVYPPFLSAPGLMGRRLTTVPLLRTEGRWQWDWLAVATALGPAVRLFLLCHPHNPVGRAWDEAELRALAELAERRDLVVCSDEIHCGLMLDGRRHRPFASLEPAVAARTITLMAPSKTFNVPGLGCAFAIIPDARLRRDFRDAMDGIVPHVNVLGLVACEAAYRDGGAWHTWLMEVLRQRRDRVESAVAAMPGLAMTHVEATYLAWIDAAGAGIENPHAFFEAAGVGLSAGRDFGPEGAFGSFVRLNFACSDSLLDEALARMARALEARAR